MSLPEKFESIQQYFDQVLEFLQNYKWIFQYPNTHIIVKNVLNQFPSEWLPYLKLLNTEDLNNLALAETKETAPDSLKYFLKQIKILTPKYCDNINKFACKFPQNSGLSLKKQHEILSFVPLIHTICERNQINSIIDVGTGLGYLPQILSNNYNYNIIGIDYNRDFIETAQLKQQLNNKNSSIKFIQHYINENSIEFFQNSYTKYLTTTTTTSPVCLTGLHACADLSITILDLFIKLDFLKCLIIMPCCYHRLKYDKITNKFENFPNSRLLKSYEIDFFNIPFLRLASQNSGKSFVKMSKLEHEEHGRNCLFRAILQDVVEQRNLQLQRIKRKSGKSKLITIEDYLTNLINTHKLIDGDINNVEFLKDIHEKWYQYKDDCCFVEILMAFQTAIQNICENIVLLDRLEFLIENGIKSCWVEKITDDSLSPRCYAIVAVKTTVNTK